MMNLIQFCTFVRVFRNIGRFTKMTVEHESTETGGHFGAKWMSVHFNGHFGFFDNTHALK